MKKVSLQEAIDIALQKVTPTELSHELGFQDTSMVYRYKKGITKSTTATRAKILYDDFGLLLDDYVSVEHLNSLAEKEQNKDNNKTVDACGHVMDKLLIVASYKGKDLRQKLLRFIADYDKRN